MTAVVALDAGGESLWRAVVDTRRDAAEHHRFVEHCRAFGTPVAAAAGYRARLVAHPPFFLALAMVGAAIGAVLGLVYGGGR